MCYCPTPTLHLNLALTGDGAFLLSPQKTHTVWFISILNYGDTENVLINHLLLVIPMSYPCHYTNLCPHKPHKHAHIHTHSIIFPYRQGWREGGRKKHVCVPLCHRSRCHLGYVRRSVCGPYTSYMLSFKNNQTEFDLIVCFTFWMFPPLTSTFVQCLVFAGTFPT